MYRETLSQKESIILKITHFKRQSHVESRLQKRVTDSCRVLKKGQLLFLTPYHCNWLTNKPTLPLAGDAIVTVSQSHSQADTLVAGGPS